jgi:4-amino-4-deoxy-L-arabinose transferase-like glycosyltransferase
LTVAGSRDPRAIQGVDCYAAPVHDELSTRLTRRDWRHLLLIAGAVVLALLLVATRYGYHRDELYFVEATHHLAWGYVDQPPLTIWIAWVAGTLAPQSLFALRVAPALAMGGVVVLAGIVAHRLGGGRVAVLSAATAIAVSGIFLAVGHLLSTTTFDILFWAVLIYLMVLLLGGADPRLWLLFGVVAGVGLLNKHLVLFLLLGLLVGLLATPQRRLLTSRWPWLGGLAAVVVWSPNLLWQISNDWPTIEMLQSLQDNNSGLGKAIEFLGLQLPFLSIVVLPIAVIGTRRMLADSQLRPIAIAFLALVAVFLVAGGKGYYIVPFYVVLVPMGMVEMERRWSAGTARISARNAIVTMVLAGFVMSPFFLPLVPLSSVGVFNGVNKELGETVGWEEMVEQVADVYQTLPAERQLTASILTGSYGEAGAIDLFGEDFGLPPAYSGHNAYWVWGPPPDTAEPVIVVGYGPGAMGSYCLSWENVTTIDNSAGVDNEERGLPISLCHQLRSAWSVLWPDLRHYN